MATPDEEHKVAVKLLVHKEQNKVIFAEVNNDFADILFSFLTLPLGTIIRLVGEEHSEPGLKVGSLTNLYRSVADLDPKFFSGDICKTMLLYPRNCAELECQRLKVNIDDAKKWEFFGHPYCSCISIRKGSHCDCPNRYAMSTSVTSCSRYEEAFFSDVTTLIIGDDFSIIPSSPRFILDLCNRFGITNMKLLTERVVHVGKKEILNLLKCLLVSKTPLTDAFLRTGHPTQYQPCSIIPPQIEDCSKKFTLKLLLRKADKKILFAEANGDFVNQIFSILAIPLGLVIGLLGNNSALGSADQLYTSTMNEDIRKYMASHVSPESDKLMHPKLVPHVSSNNQIQLLPLPTGLLRDANIQLKGYTSNYSRNYREINPKFHDGDCVKSRAAFIVTDDLVVKPISTLFSLEFLESLRIPNKDIEEKVVSFGTDQAYKLLKSSLLSESALTEALMVDILKTPKQEK